MWLCRISFLLLDSLYSLYSLYALGSIDFVESIDFIESIHFIHLRNTHGECVERLRRHTHRLSWWRRHTHRLSSCSFDTLNTFHSRRTSDWNYLNLQIIRFYRIIRRLLFSSVKICLKFRGLPWILVCKSRDGDSGENLLKFWQS